MYNVVGHNILLLQPCVNVLDANGVGHTGFTNQQPNERSNSKQNEKQNRKKKHNLSESELMTVCFAMCVPSYVRMYIYRVCDMMRRHYIVACSILIKWPAYM